MNFYKLSFLSWIISADHAWRTWPVFITLSTLQVYSCYSTSWLFFLLCACVVCVCVCSHTCDTKVDTSLWVFWNPQHKQKNPYQTGGVLGPMNHHWWFVFRHNPQVTLGVAHLHMLWVSKTSETGGIWDFFYIVNLLWTLNCSTKINYTQEYSSKMTDGIELVNHTLFTLPRAGLLLKD